MHRQQSPAMLGPMTTLALIAHDGRKADLVAWAAFNRNTLARCELVATKHTARLLREKVGLAVDELRSGPEGGDAQIACMVVTRELDAVFFFVIFALNAKLVPAPAPSSPRG